MKDTDIFKVNLHLYWSVTVELKDKLSSFISFETRLLLSPFNADLKDNNQIRVLLWISSQYCMQSFLKLHVKINQMHTLKVHLIWYLKDIMIVTILSTFTWSMRKLYTKIYVYIKVYINIYLRHSDDRYRKIKQQQHIDFMNNVKNPKQQYLLWERESPCLNLR